MRPLLHPLLLALACVGLVGACNKADQGKDGKEAEEAEKAKTGEKQVDPDADNPEEDEKQATFADPKAKPPPAPEGSITLEDPWLYVQTCAEPHPCPSLKQPAGDAHCRELVLGGHDVWRLPSKDEVARFKGVEALEQREGYHWTRTPDPENLALVWIVNPEDPDERTRATTIQRDRKEFVIRCVKEP